MELALYFAVTGSDLVETTADDTNNGVLYFMLKYDNAKETSDLNQVITANIETVARLCHVNAENVHNISKDEYEQNVC